jgi:2-methylisocitrate lyase-like PEP mutase family enzyme
MAVVMTSAMDRPPAASAAGGAPVSALASSLASSLASEASGATSAARLRSLHRPGRPLVLPNVWDAGSARVVVAAGFAAVATSSAAVADSLGYPDGEATPVEEMLDAVARIANAVSVPVTADFERGYGLPPAQLVERLAASGAVGCNLEDSDPSTRALVDAERQADFLAAVRQSALSAGIDLVINARIDVFLDDVRFDGARDDDARDDGARDDGVGFDGDSALMRPTMTRLDEAIRRARLYVAAGADCVYPIRMTSAADIRAMVTETGGPVNVLGGPDAPPLSELATLGVARISFGGGIYRATYQRVGELVAEIADASRVWPEPEPMVS